MEWVMTTGKTLDEAKERALDQLGVARDDAEFEVVEEARTGLFGRVKSEARVRARVKPTQARPKQDRRERRRSGNKSPRNDRTDGRGKRKASSTTSDETDESDEMDESDESVAAPAAASKDQHSKDQHSKDQQRSSSNGQRGRSKRQRTQKEHAAMEHDTEQETEVSPQEVGDAAAAFMIGLTEAFGAEATTEVEIDGTEIDVRVSGDELGLLVGPGGRTLTAVQDLARVSSQRRLGDHETRLRIDVGAYRAKRKVALEKFAASVASKVIESGTTKALEPMSSADRKVLHDAITDIDGVTSRSEGDEPDRRVVISPA